jgi:hypothetical protein
LGGEPLGLAAVDDLHGWNILVDAAVAHVHHSRGGLDADVLQQCAGLLDLGGQGVPVVRVAGEGSGALKL